MTEIYGDRESREAGDGRLGAGRREGAKGAVNPSPASRFPFPGSSQLTVPNRDTEGKRAPHAGSGIHLDVAAEELGEATGVVESEARAAMTPSEPGIELCERLE